MSVALTFLAPPPGLSPLRDFSLDAVVGAPGLYALVAEDDRNLRLYVVDAGVYLPHYAPVITDEHAGALGLTTADDAMVLVVATPAATGTTVNLMAPIVVNSSTGISAQVILDGPDWPIQEILGARAA